MELPYAYNLYQRQFGTLPLQLAIPSDPDGITESFFARPGDDPAIIDERMPYWAHLWPSAEALAIFLATSPLIQPGTAVLEIGCGLGIPGIVAGLRGARVTLTDYDPEALAFAAANWQQNLPNVPVDCQVLDWREPNPALAADLVLAADVAYERRSFQPLMAALDQLTRPGGKVIISEPNRSVAADFRLRLQEVGFQHTATVISGQPPTGCLLFIR